MRLAEPLDLCWLASLDLAFERRDAATILARRRHAGPLRVQKALYPEDESVCHAIVLHPPAGIAGGDRLRIDCAVDAAAHALLTTPGAGKWYRASGLGAEQTVNLKVGAGGTAEWLPQESILFDGAEATMRTTVELAADARFIGVETLCFGRRESGEQFASGALRLETDVRIDGKPLWRERGELAGGCALMASPVGLRGYTVCSTVLAAGAEVSADALAACRQVVANEADAQYGVSALPRVLIGRYLGHSPEAARRWFVDLWRVLRPALLSREMVLPRIWNT